jgi:lysophospholipase L1-like esterase
MLQSAGFCYFSKKAFCMKAKKSLLISLVFNAAFTLFFLGLAYTYRDKLFQGYVSLKGDPKIIMFGNSITAQGKWVELLGRTDVLVRALPGQCTYHFLQALQPLVLDMHPQVCFVMGGINDITIGVTMEKIQANYQKILESLKQNNIEPIVTLTLYEQNDPVSKKEVDSLNNFLVTYCKANQIEYLDLNQSIADSTGLMPEYAVDKTHLNVKAYKVWAQEIEKILVRKGI